MKDGAELKIVIHVSFSCSYNSSSTYTFYYYRNYLYLSLWKKFVVVLMKWLKVLRKLQEIYLVFHLSFTVSVTPSINATEFSNNFMVLIISFIYSFKINKVNPFPALTVPFSPTFLSNLYITFEVKLLTNGKL